MSNYIALELKVIEVLAPQAARASGVHEDRVLAGLVRLYHRCWSLKADRLTRLQLAGLFGGEKLDELVASLVEAGLLEAGEADWRVRGADRYLRLHEARSKGGKASVGNLKRGSRRPSAGETQPGLTADTPPAGPRLEPGSAPGSLPALTPNTEHRTPNTTEEEEDPPPQPLTLAKAPSAPAGASIASSAPNAGPVAENTVAGPMRSPEVPLERGPLAYEKPTTPPEAWLVDEFFAWAQWTRQEAGWLAQRRPRANLGAWFSEVLSTPGMTTLRLQVAFRAFARDRHWLSASPPAPFEAFVKCWRNFVPPEAPQSAGLPPEVRELVAGRDALLGALSALTWRSERGCWVGATADPYQAQWLGEQLADLSRLRIESLRGAA